MRKSGSKVRASRDKNGKLAARESRVLPTLSGSLTINVRDGVVSNRVRPREIGGTLLVETERALRRPGVKRGTVFSVTGVSSYSAYPRDPSMIVRESHDGIKTVGRLVNGHFRAKTAK